MKKLIIISFLLLVGGYGFGQENYIHDNNPVLNAKEWQVLDPLFEKERKSFSFKNKKGEFIEGHSFTDIIIKSKFFLRFILTLLLERVLNLIFFYCSKEF